MTWQQCMLITHHCHLNSRVWWKWHTENREHHELTRGLIRIRPAGISFSKNQIRSRTSKFPWVTRLNGSGTCSITDHLQLTGTRRYPQVSMDTWHLLIYTIHITQYRHVAFMVHSPSYILKLSSFFITGTRVQVYYINSLLLFLPRWARILSVQATALVLEHLNDLTLRNEPRDLTPSMKDSRRACWFIREPMPKLAYS